ncbi:hypothetical protein VTH06DRAFT_7100 [Thermothelomyces fergusii]
MDALLQTLGAQTVNFAIRSGLALTSRYAVQQCSRLLKSVNDKAVRAELGALQKVLDDRIKILSPALDLIEFKSSRGNAFLEAAVPLAKSLHREIVRLGKRLDRAATAEEERYGSSANRCGSRVSDARHAELLVIIKDIKELLARIDRDIPLLQFAITVSGEKMSSSMTPGISPSRMMQASALLSFADAQFVSNPRQPMQVGSCFTLTLYMLFLGHSQVGPSPGSEDISPLTPPGNKGHITSEVPYGLGEGERKPIWQEVIHKARVRLCRVPVDWVFDPAQGYKPGHAYSSHFPGVVSRRRTIPSQGPSDGYSYHLEIIEDLDDGRLHDGDDSSFRPYEDIPMAGLRESIPIHQISKIFYTDTGRILNIGNSDEKGNNPVLLLKRDINAKCPIKMRQEWFEEPEPEKETGPPSSTADESSESDEQEDIDRQLWEESEHTPKSWASQDSTPATYLPAHLDPEWLALEVHTEAEGGDDEEDEEDEEEEEEEEADTKGESGARQRALSGSAQASGDDLLQGSKLLTQLERVSIGAGSPAQNRAGQPAVYIQKPRMDGAASYVTRSPFGSIISSLSLLEMLIRLTSLQEFQQVSHLAIPDHILMFFLEETSTTGLHGEAQWRARTDAKRRMGFDPYTDSFLNQNEE